MSILHTTPERLIARLSSTIQAGIEQTFYEEIRKSSDAFARRAAKSLAEKVVGRIEHMTDLRSGDLRIAVTLDGVEHALADLVPSTPEFTPAATPSPLAR